MTREQKDRANERRRMSRLKSKQEKIETNKVNEKSFVSIDALADIKQEVNKINMEKPKDIPAEQEAIKLPKPKRHFFRIRRNREWRKPKPVQEQVAPPEPKTEKPDVASEQEEPYYTTDYCPESITDVKKIKHSPENHLEINIVKRSRVVDTFAIPIDKKVFHYKDKQYKIVEEGIYLLPTKGGLLMPSSFYREGKADPVGFRNTNKGITGKALSLLYMEQLYTSLLYAEDNKYNLFIVILLIACLIAFGVACYFVFMHGGGIIAPPQPNQYVGGP
jgi:hypothetical protein